jgi:hypothetical protein
MSSIIVAISKADGKLKTILEVPSGTACNCKCLSCGDDFIAKKGEIMTHHFSHKDNNKLALSCLENALHAAATKLLSEQTSIPLPLHKFQSIARNTSIKNDKATLRDVSTMGETFSIVSTVVDYSHERMHPDVIAKVEVYGEVHEVFVEIYSNIIMLNKRERPINKHGISVLTICFDDFNANQYSIKDIEDQLSNAINYKWLFLNGDLRKHVENNWNEKHLENPITEDQIASYCDELKAYFVNRPFFIPVHPYMNEGVGYETIDGEFISFKSLNIPKMRQEFGISEINVDQQTLVLSLMASDLAFQLHVKLAYFGMDNDVDLPRFLVSTSDEFPSVDQFQGTLTWGSFLSLEQKMSSTVSERDIALGNHLAEALGAITATAQHSGLGGQHNPRFPEDSGIYSNIGGTESLYGYGQIEIQDVLLTSLEARTQITVDFLRSFLASNQIHSRSSNLPSTHEQKLDAITRTYKKNGIHLPKIEKTIEGLTYQQQITNDSEFLEGLILGWLEDKVLVRSGDHVIPNFPFTSISPLIDHKGIWPMTPRIKTGRF